MQIKAKQTKPPNRNILLVKQIISRAGKEEGKGTCFDILPQLAPVHHAILSNNLLLSFCLSCRVLSNLPAAFQCFLLSAFLPFFSFKLSLAFSWTYVTPTKTKITVSSSWLTSTFAEIILYGNRFTANICTFKSIHNTACSSFWKLVLRYAVRVAYYTSVECPPFYSPSIHVVPII